MRYPFHEPFSRGSGRIGAQTAVVPSSASSWRVRALVHGFTGMELSGADVTADGLNVQFPDIMEEGETLDFVVEQTGADGASVSFPVTLTSSTALPALALRALLSSRGMTFATSIQSPARQARPGIGGRGTLQDFCNVEYEGWTSGIQFMPDIFQPANGQFNTDLARGFLDAGIAGGKKLHGHCLVYPKRMTSTWWAGALTAGNWETKIDTHMAAIAAMEGIDQITSWDVLNEVIDGGGQRGDDLLYNVTGGSGYRTTVFEMAREHFPDADLYWCQDQSEQLGDSWNQTLATNVLKAIEADLNAGAPIDGYNFQSHLVHCKSINKKALAAFVHSLRAQLGLKIRIGEIDTRTGYDATYFPAEPRPADYANYAAYNAAMASMIEQVAPVLLPHVQWTSGDLCAWNAADVSHWMDSASAVPQGEKPALFDDGYAPKPQYYALFSAVKALPKVAAEPDAPDLVHNGSFDVDTAGWTVTTGGAAVVGGKLRLNTNAAGSASVNQRVYCGLPGQTMRFTFDRTIISSQGRVAISTSASTSNALVQATDYVSQTGGYLDFVVPASGYVYVLLWIATGSGADKQADFDNISIVPLP